MGTSRSITLVDVTPPTIGGPAAMPPLLEYCSISAGVAVGFLFCGCSARMFLSDITGHLSDCVDAVGGDLTAGFLLFAASDMMSPHSFSVSVPDKVRDLQRPHRLVDNTDRLPLLSHHLVCC